MEMNGDHPAEDVVRGVRELYRNDPLARRFFDLNAARQRDANSTSLDSICRKLEINRGDAVALAKMLEAAGCGEFKVGRRGSVSRIEWAYSCISLGRAAAGETIQLEEKPESQQLPEDEDEDEVRGVVTEPGAAISVAKQELSKRLGVATSQIEIIVRY
jgi:hypothetical protein